MSPPDNLTATAHGTASLLEARLSEIPEPPPDKGFQVAFSRELVLIPSAEYDALCIKAKAGYAFSRWNLYLTFEIFGGDHDAKQLFWTCPLPGHREGRIRVKPGTKLHDTWALALGHKPTRKDRLAFSVFPKKLYRVLVDTSRKDRHGKEKAELLQESIVVRVISCQSSPLPLPASEIPGTGD